MLTGLNVVLFVTTAVFVALYLLRRRTRLITTQFKLRSSSES